jgi:very-short-patch-repair endonuclease
VIEVDGNIHEEQREYDEERDAYMRNYGVSIIRIPARDIFQDIA